MAQAGLIRVKFLTAPVEAHHGGWIASGF